MVALYPRVLLLIAFCEGSSAMRFSAAFAASVFGAVEELLTVPWYQGVEQVTVRGPEIERRGTTEENAALLTSVLGI